MNRLLAGRPGTIPEHLVHAKAWTDASRLRRIRTVSTPAPLCPAPPSRTYRPPSHHCSAHNLAWGRHDNFPFEPNHHHPTSGSSCAAVSTRQRVCGQSSTGRAISLDRGWSLLLSSIHSILIMHWDLGAWSGTTSSRLPRCKR